MCEECRQYPHANRCPNNPKEEGYVYRCEVCDEKIYTGDKFAKINGELLCESCLKSIDYFEWLSYLGIDVEIAK